MPSMPGYTVKNLKDLTDQAAAHGLGPSMEARFAREDLGCEQVGLSYQRLAPGVRQPFAHRHGHDEELYVVTGGEGEARLDGESVPVRQWDVVRVSPETVRAFAAGPDGLEFLAVGAAGMTDAQMVADPWES